MEPVLRLVVGLGNPDEKYAGTRHNIGRDFIDFIASSQKLPSFRKQGETEYTTLLYEALHPKEIYLLKSLSYMNETGGSLRQFMQKKGIKPEEILVIVDEFMLPFGELRLGLKGSAGGHNGMKSIIAALGTQDFKRLRVGIGPVPPEQDPAEFVLKKFTANERKAGPRLADAIAKSIDVFSSQGFEKAATFSNKNHL